MNNCSYGFVCTTFFSFIYWQGKDGRSFMKFRADISVRFDGLLIFLHPENFAYKQINKEVGAKANP